jgi:hypothetical protein
MRGGVQWEIYIPSPQNRISLSFSPGQKVGLITL